MKFQAQRQVLVIVGGWNPHIVINPEWVKKYLFPEVQSFTTDLMMDMDRQPIPCITAGNIQISMSNNRLCFASGNTEESDYEAIQTVACKLADYLPHTPVSAYGVNFSFLVESKVSSFMNKDVPLTKALAPDGGGIIEEQTRCSIAYQQAILTVAAKEKPMAAGAGMAIELEFNYHHLISNISQLKAGFATATISDYRKHAQGIAENFERLSTTG